MAIEWPGLEVDDEVKPKGRRKDDFIATDSEDDKKSVKKEREYNLTQGCNLPSVTLCFREPFVQHRSWSMRINPEALLLMFNPAVV